MSKILKKNSPLQIAAICSIAVLAMGTTQFVLAKDYSRIKLERESSAMVTMIKISLNLETTVTGKNSA